MGKSVKRSWSVPQFLHSSIWPRSSDNARGQKSMGYDLSSNLIIYTDFSIRKNWERIPFLPHAPLYPCNTSQHKANHHYLWCWSSWLPNIAYPATNTKQPWWGRGFEHCSGSHCHCHQHGSECGSSHHHCLSCCYASCSHLNFWNIYPTEGVSKERTSASTLSQTAIENAQKWIKKLPVKHSFKDHIIKLQE